MPLCARFLRRHMYGEYKYERPINMDQDIFDIIIRATALDGASRPSVEQMEHDLRLVWNSKVWPPPLLHVYYNSLPSSTETLKYDAAF